MEQVSQARGGTGMKITGKLIFSLALVLLFIFLIVVTMGFRARPRTVPMVVLVPALAFSVIQFGVELRDATGKKEKSKKAPKEEGGSEEEKEKKLPPQVKIRRELIAIAWLLGFFASIVLIGLLPSIPLFVLAFMRFFGRESWWLSAIFAVSCFAFVYIVFVWLLQNQLYPGVLLPLLNL